MGDMKQFLHRGPTNIVGHDSRFGHLGDVASAAVHPCNKTSGFYVKTATAYVINTFAPVLNPLKPELNPICYLLALLGAHHFLHFSRIRVKLLTLR